MLRHTSVMVSIVITHFLGLLCMHIHIQVMVCVVITHFIVIFMYAYSHISHGECCYYTFYSYIYVCIFTHQSWLVLLLHIGILMLAYLHTGVIVSIILLHIL